MITLTPAENQARQRFRKLGAIFIDHPHYSPVYREVRMSVALAGADEEVPCVQLTGPPGVGKSTLKRKLVADFPRRKSARTIRLPRQPPARCDHVPIVRISMPEKPTVKALVRAGLKEIGDPTWSSGNELSILNDRFDRFVGACGTMAILIDDAHRAVDAGGVVESAHIAEWLTARHSANPVVMILGGLGRTKHLFDKDLQLARRWDEELRLEPYRWLQDDGQPHKDQGSFIAILQQFRDLSPVQFDSALDVETDDVAYRFIYASRGLIGLVKKILKRAVMILAADDDTDGVITLPLLEAAYHQAIRGELRQPHNAFAETFTPNLKEPPPALDDDHLLLPSPERRRRAKSRKMRNSEALVRLRKG